MEAAALGILTAAALLPYLVALAHHPVRRFAVEGDYAGLEIATRYVFTGRTLLGAYSRFGFNHPGPLYFYLTAPIYFLLGKTSTALWAGAIIVNMAAAASAVAIMRLYASRAHAVASALVVSVWLDAFGNSCLQPWNPMVVVLPLLAFLVCAAQVVRGKSGPIAVMTFLGALVAETHLSTLPTVAGIAAIAGTGFAGAARRRGGLSAADCRAIGLGATIFVLCALPIAIEQVTSQTGNLTKICKFFLAAHDHKPVNAALAEWIEATSWMPKRVARDTLAGETDSQMMASAEMPRLASDTGVRVALLWLGAVAVGGVVAARRRDGASATLLAVGALGSVIAVSALQRVVGPTMFYLVFWATAASTVAWMGVATTVASVVTERARATLCVAGARPRPFAWVVPCVLAMAIASRANWGPASHENFHSRLALEARDAYEVLASRLRTTHETPVIHVEGAWYVGLELINELTRDGFGVAVEPRDRWILGRQFPAPPAVLRPLHVYTRTDIGTLGTANCLEPLVDVHHVALFISPTEVESCPAHLVSP